MDVPGLKEYRCACGKLLFKGLLIFSVVEIKCKRCGSVRVFDEQGKDDPVSFIVKIDGDWNIIDASRAVLRAGWERRSLIGKHLSEVFPLLKGTPEMSHFATSVEGGKPFEMRSNAFLLRDGSFAPAESYVIPCSAGRNQTPSSHQVITVFTT